MPDVPVTTSGVQVPRADGPFPQYATLFCITGTAVTFEESTRGDTPVAISGLTLSAGEQATVYSDEPGDWIHQVGAGEVYLLWGDGSTPPAVAIDMPQLATYLETQGWTTSNLTASQFSAQNGGPTYVVLRSAMQVCDFTGLSGPLSNDLRDGLALQGKTCP